MQGKIAKKKNSLSLLALQKQNEWRLMLDDILRSDIFASGFGKTAGSGVSTGCIFPSDVLATLTGVGSGAGDGEPGARARCEPGLLQCSVANTALLGLGSGPGLLLFIAQSSPTLFSPLDCSTPGFPVLHRLLEFALPEV